MAKKFEKKEIVPILEWFFGVIFILYGLLGLLSFTASVIGGLFLLVGGVFILPAVRQFIDKQYNVKIHGFLKWVIFIILVGLGASLIR